MAKPGRPPGSKDGSSEGQFNVYMTLKLNAELDKFVEKNKGPLLSSRNQLINNAVRFYIAAFSAANGNINQEGFPIGYGEKAEPKKKAAANNASAFIASKSWQRRRCEPLASSPQEGRGTMREPLPQSNMALNVHAAMRFARRQCRRSLQAKRKKLRVVFFPCRKVIN